ncbi:MAG: hypothetical protein ABJA64_03375 [Candidatus Saccharibacteria bacterium]
MNDEQDTTLNTDDVSVLRVLLHTIQGISPVAGNSLDYIAVEDELEF